MTAEGTHGVTLTPDQLALARHLAQREADRATAAVMAGYRGMLGTKAHADHLAATDPALLAAAAAANGFAQALRAATYTPTDEETAAADAAAAQAAAIADAVLAGDDAALDAALAN